MTSIKTSTSMDDTIRAAVLDYIGLGSAEVAERLVNEQFDKDYERLGVAEVSSRRERFRADLDARVRLEGDLHGWAVDAAYWHGMGLPCLARKSAHDIAVAVGLAIAGESWVIKHVFRKAGYEAADRARMR